MNEFLLSSQKGKIERIVFYLLALFLPTQLGKHFWPEFSTVLGIRIDYLSPTIFFTDILVMLLFVFWALRKFGKKTNKNSNFEILASRRSGRNSKFQDVSTKLIPLLIFILLVNVFTQRYIASGLYSLLKLLEMSFVAYYIAKFITEKAIHQKLYIIFCIGIIFQSLLAIAQYFQQGSVGGILYFLGERYFNASTPGIANASINGELILRPYGTFPHPNVLAGYILIGMILITFSSRKLDSHIVKKLKYIAILLGTIVLFLSMSRISIILWVFIVSYHLIVDVKKRLLSLIFFGIILIFLITPFASRFTKVNLAEEAIVQRKILIESSIKIIKINPYFGVGLGNFLPTLSKLQNPLSLGLYLQPVHNIFLLITAEIGIIGFGIFVWFLRKTFINIMNIESKIRKPQFFALGAILILGLVDHYWLTLQQGQLLFAYVIGLCWANIKTPFKSPRVEKF